jgi:CheY-like chemotaxis protein
MATIFLADDDSEVRALFRQMLEAGAHAVVVGRSGAALIEDLAANAYDVVVTDLHMPVVDGWAVLRWLKANRPGVPVIAAGGDSGPPASMDGFAAVLQKPFRRAELLAAVATVVRKTDVRP